MTQGTAFRLHPLDAALGAEILDLDLSRPLDDETFAAVRRAFLESNGLLVFRAQYITPEQHIEFSRRFGPLMIHVLRQYCTCSPGIRRFLEFPTSLRMASPSGSATQAPSGIPTSRTRPNQASAPCFTPWSFRRKVATPHLPICTPPTMGCPPRSSSESKASARCIPITTAMSASADRNGGHPSPKNKRPKCARSCILSCAFIPKPAAGRCS